MAQVASCPQCNHDLLVPDDADRESMARCPECAASFQITQAALREVPALQVVESDVTSDEFHAPLSDAPTSADEIAQQPPQFEPSQATIPSDSASARTIPDDLPASPPSQSTADRIDDWFRSAKTVADTPPSFAADFVPVSDLSENSADADIPFEASTSAPTSGAAWDDSQHMDELLADVEPVPASKPANDAPAPPAGPRIQSENIAAASSVSELPVFSKRKNGKPRRRSLLGTLAMTAAAGVIGLALGYYALLWMLGAGGDFLQIAQYLPPVMLPAELQEKPRQIAATTKPIAPVQHEESAAATPSETTEEPAEVQATFTQQEQPSSQAADRADERYGIEEPAAFAAEEPVALDDQPAPPPAESATAAPRPTGAPSFTADQLSASLQEAEQAQPMLVAGKLEDGREVQRAKADSYRVLSGLAQHSTFTDPHSNPESVAASLQAADTLFRTTLSDANTRGEVARIVPKWIASPHREQGGVFFAAALSGGTPMGPVAEYQATLDTGQTLHVLIPPTVERDAADSSRPTGVVGWIVERPAEQIHGYNGEAPQAVWVGRLIAID